MCGGQPSSVKCRWARRASQSGDVDMKRTLRRRRTLTSFLISLGRSRQINAASGVHDRVNERYCFQGEGVFAAISHSVMSSQGCPRLFSGRDRARFTGFAPSS
jgi:hypothetical protein